METLQEGEADFDVRTVIEFINEYRKNDLQDMKEITELNAIRYLRATNFDTSKAINLYMANHKLRKELNLLDYNPLCEPLATELFSKKFTVLPNHGNDGPTVVIFTAKLHKRKKSHFNTTLGAIVHQLDIALRHPVTQRLGLVLIFDMKKMNPSNFDYDLYLKIVNMLRGAIPAKLKRIYLVSAPPWFKASFRVLSLFLKNKIRYRVSVVAAADIKNHESILRLPKYLGGFVDYSHPMWITFCSQAMNNEWQYDYIQYNGSSRDKLPLANAIDLIPRSRSDSSMAGASTMAGALSVAGPPTMPRNTSMAGPPTMPRTASMAGPPTMPRTPSIAKDSSMAVASTPKAVSDIREAPIINYNDRRSQFKTHTLEEFPGYVRSRGYAELASEYYQLRRLQYAGPSVAWSNDENGYKNRYRDVQCFDHCRVLLSTDRDQSDNVDNYIHANYVHGAGLDKKYILTQGPLEHTAIDFWQMIWEQHTLVIVMLARVIEKNSNKCYQYWALPVGEILTFEHFTVKTSQVFPEGDFILTKIELSNTKTRGKRLISHWQYLNWPDYDVPTTAQPFVNFMMEIRKDQSNILASLGDYWKGRKMGPPIVVHCSAGVGRAGTFVTIEICASILISHNTINVPLVLLNVRRQRAHAIQSTSQYIFCHLALIEFAIIVGKLKPFDLSEFKTFVKLAIDQGRKDVIKRQKKVRRR